jgi:hypothetical protein
MWQAARNAVDMAGATVLALQIFDGVSRSTQPDPKMALGFIRAIVVALIEGYQGKISGVMLHNALLATRQDLIGRDGIPDAAMVEQFKTRLL